MSITSALEASPGSLRDLTVNEAIAEATYEGLTAAPKTLPPWLFYDQAGSALFEQITRLPEYYLTRTERDLLRRHANEIFELCECSDGNAPRSSLRVVELGAGTATKTGVLLRSLVHRQREVRYQPIDISASALEEAALILRDIPGVKVSPCVANYVTDAVSIERGGWERVLALYIGSSIGNFSPQDARAILLNLRQDLRPGDSLLLGTDLAPSATKSIGALLAAYNDQAGVTAAFNRNVLSRLNRDLGTKFETERFRHCTVWNDEWSRIEMHLQSLCVQSVKLPQTRTTPATLIRFAPGDTIHTENSYKFTGGSIASLLDDSGFTLIRSFVDDGELFAVTLAGVH